MTPLLSSVSSEIHPYALSDEENLGVGRIVRAVAELDEIANIYVEQLLDLKDWQSFVVFGKMPTSARLRLAKTIADTQGNDASMTHRDCFDNEEYRSVIKFRNTVAHGVLLGKTDDGNIAFLIQETSGSDVDIVFATVNAYSPSAFKGFPKMAEEIIQKLEGCLNLRPSRDKLRQQALCPHPKAGRSKTPKRANAHPRAT